ncbi:hypothetical protein BJY00DRAFT_66859 [Aspergillus carlsbadensis]|nr:hypothetical protein BJY00DRAFT_66859 [Aspergillus carlsbadensis]
MVIYSVYYERMCTIHLSVRLEASLSFDLVILGFLTALFTTSPHVYYHSDWIGFFFSFFGKVITHQEVHCTNMGNPWH